MIVEAHELTILRWIHERRRTKVEPTLLEGHERGRRKEPILRAAKHLLQHAAFHSVQTENDLPCIQIQQTAQHRATLPYVQIVRHRAGIVPDQLPAAVERYRVRVVPNAVALVAQEVRVFGGPADLHHSGSDDEHLVVPAAGIDLEGTPDAFEGVRIATRLQTVRGDFEVLADVPGVEHDVHVVDVRHFVRVLTAVDED